MDKSKGKKAVKSKKAEEPTSKKEKATAALQDAQGAVSALKDSKPHRGNWWTTLKRITVILPLIGEALKAIGDLLDADKEENK